MTVIGVGAHNSIDEVTQYQMGSYASSNEAIWRIFFSFPNHERHPTVVHLAVHLESGQKSLFYNTECITTNYSTAVYNLDQFFSSMC